MLPNIKQLESTQKISINKLINQKMPPFPVNILMRIGENERTKGRRSLRTDWLAGWLADWLRVARKKVGFPKELPLLLPQFHFRAPHKKSC